jgi:hypothetical protein
LGSGVPAITLNVAPVAASLVAGAGVAFVSKPLLLRLKPTLTLAGAACSELIAAANGSRRNIGFLWNFMELAWQLGRIKACGASGYAWFPNTFRYLDLGRN